MSKSGGTIYRRGDLLLWVTYIPDGNGYNRNGNDSKQPALAIASSQKKSGDRKAWVIPLESAWRYCNSDGFPTTFAYKRTADIGNHIGIGDGLQARRQIFQMLGDYMPQVLEAYEFEMVKEDRHGIAREIGEIVLRNQGVVVGGSIMRAF